MQDILVFLQNHWMLSLAFIIVLFLLIILEFIKARRGTNGLTPAKLIALINHDNATLIDVRSADNYATGCIVGSTSLPLSELKNNTKKIEKYKNTPIVLVCATGAESQIAANLLAKQGFNARMLIGGLRAWREADMPLVKN